MDFYAVLDQVLDKAGQRGRVTYNALKRQFGLDDACLQDLKDEIIEAQRLAVDENDRVLVWTGDATAPPPPASAPTAVQARPPDLGPQAYTPAHLAEKILTARPALAGERAWGLRRGPAPRGGGAPPRHAGRPRDHTDHYPRLPRRAVPRPRGPGARHPGVGAGPGPLSCLRRAEMVANNRGEPGLCLCAPGAPGGGACAAGGGDQRTYPRGPAGRSCLPGRMAQRGLSS